jgi:hypothetical protein
MFPEQAQLCAEGCFGSSQLGQFAIDMGELGLDGGQPRAPAAR